MGSEDLAAWTELISKMKEGIILSFDSNILMRDEDVKRSESQRLMPGWNFCTFFILKVGSAFIL
jgi:trafficking protein particle complex subunit 10